MVRKVFENLEKLQDFVAAEVKGKFVRQSVTAGFGRGDVLARCKERKSKEIRWGGVAGSAVPFNGSPFVVIGRERFECVWAPLRSKSRRGKGVESDHQYSVNQNHVNIPKTKTKKLGCPAAVMVTEIVRFPQFAVSADKRKARDKKSKALRDLLASNTAVVTQHEFVCDFPPDSSHKFHIMGKGTDVDIQHKNDTAAADGAVQDDIERAQSLFRQLLSSLSTFSYQVTDVALLQSAIGTLQQLLQTVRGTIIPSDNHIQVPHSQNTTKELPISESHSTDSVVSAAEL